MKSIMRLFCLMLPMACMAVFMDSCTPIHRDVTAVVYGKVVRKDTGDPIEGARVLFTAPGIYNKDCFTDATGYYEFNDLRRVDNQEYTIDASKQGFRSDSRYAVRPVAGRRLEINLVLEPY